MGETVKYLLGEEEIPTSWVNLLAELPGDPPPPPLSPQTSEPAGQDDLSPIFAMGLIHQEVSAEPQVEIPDEVRDIYRLWRPTPLLRARRLEQELGTPAHIYYKYEGVSPAGSHKPNSAVPQAYFNKQEGVRKLVTETGAGQWGSALTLACQLSGLESSVRGSHRFSEARRGRGRTSRPPLHHSPSISSELTSSQSEHRGRPRLAVSEAVVAAGAGAPTTRSASCSTTFCSARPSSAGGDRAGSSSPARRPTSSLGASAGERAWPASTSLPSSPEKLRPRWEPRFVAAKQRPVSGHDHSATTPMTTATQSVEGAADARCSRSATISVPAPVHAGGLRDHGDAPGLRARRGGSARGRRDQADRAFEAAVRCPRCEGITPRTSRPTPCAPLRPGQAAKLAGEDLSSSSSRGHGDFDMAAFDA